MKSLKQLQSPLWRFYLMLTLTVLLLAFSLNQLYLVLNSGAQPSVDARLVLNAVQQSRLQHKTLSCQADESVDCSDSLFIIYPPETWQGQTDQQPGQVIPLADSDGQIQLCSVEPGQELLCLNQLNWPKQQGIRVELAYLFYLLLLLCLFYISRNLFRDIEVLRQSALQEIRYGKLPAFKLSSRSYLAPLSQSLKNMTEKIAQLNAFQAEMAETVCHDIKTPVARLKLISHLLTPERVVKSQAEIAVNLQEIEANIYDYLRLAQNEYLPQDYERTQVNLVEFCQALIEKFHGYSSVPVHLHLQPGVPVCYTSDQLLLQRAVSNLLSNALRFARTEVRLTLTTAQSQLLIEISDDGPGWQQPVTYQHDFQLAHHGLGLSIVRRVAEQHQGELKLSISPLGGACCTLVLPMDGHSQNP